MTGDIIPAPRGHHLGTVLVFIGVVRLSIPPLAEGGHGRVVDVRELALAVQVVDADENPAEAGLADVGSQHGVGGVVLGHDQVTASAPAVILSLPVPFPFLHQQVHLAIRLFQAGDSCGGAYC